MNWLRLNGAQSTIHPDNGISNSLFIQSLQTSRVNCDADWMAVNQVERWIVVSTNFNDISVDDEKSTWMDEWVTSRVVSAVLQALQAFDQSLDDLPPRFRGQIVQVSKYSCSHNNKENQLTEKSDMPSSHSYGIDHNRRPLSNLIRNGFGKVFHQWKWVDYRNLLSTTWNALYITCSKFRAAGESSTIPLISFQLREISPTDSFQSIPPISATTFS